MKKKNMNMQIYVENFKREKSLVEKKKKHYIKKSI